MRPADRESCLLWPRPCCSALERYIVMLHHQHARTDQDGELSAKERLHTAVLPSNTLTSLSRRAPHGAQHALSV